MALNFANNNSLSAITSLPATVSGGVFNLISTQTASSSATIDFTSGLDSTYKEYIFKLYNIHPVTDGVQFTFNGSDDSSSHSYDITKTTTAFRYYHGEDGSNGSMAYSSSTDLAQSTSDQRLNHGDQLGNGADENFVGYLHLFDPSSSVFVKHFIAQTQMNSATNYSVGGYTAGYFNTTNPITAVQFKASSGSIESGVIKMYGVT